MDYQKLANLLFPNVTLTPEDLELRYPPRDLPEGARVTRFAPSPTGFLHVGGLFGALTDVMIARASKGVAYLRIEDTDKKREVADGVSAILEGFRAFGVRFDEGVTGFGTETGDYGPYTQSRRKEIYHVVAKSLVEQGLSASFVDPSDPENFEKAIRPNTKAVYLETLGNPNSDIPDIDAISPIVGSRSCSDKNSSLNCIARYAVSLRERLTRTVLLSLR